MQRRTKGILLLVSFLFVILSGSLIYLRAAEDRCIDYGCLGQAGCLQGLGEWKGCTKDNPCIGGGSMKCEGIIPPPI